MPGVYRPSGYDDGEKKERMQDGIWAFITISETHVGEKNTQKGQSSRQKHAGVLKKRV